MTVLMTQPDRPDNQPISETRQPARRTKTSSWWTDPVNQPMTNDEDPMDELKKIGIEPNGQWTASPIDEPMNSEWPSPTQPRPADPGPAQADGLTGNDPGQADGLTQPSPAPVTMTQTDSDPDRPDPDSEGQWAMTGRPSPDSDPGPVKGRRTVDPGPAQLNPLLDEASSEPNPGNWTMTRPAGQVKPIDQTMTVGQTDNEEPSEDPGEPMTQWRTQWKLVKDKPASQTQLRTQANYCGPIVNDPIETQPPSQTRPSWRPIVDPSPGASPDWPRKLAQTQTQWPIDPARPSQPSWPSEARTQLTQTMTVAQLDGPAMTDNNMTDNEEVNEKWRKDNDNWRQWNQPINENWRQTTRLVVMMTVMTDRRKLKENDGRKWQWQLTIMTMTDEGQLMDEPNDNGRMKPDNDEVTDNWRWKPDGPMTNDPIEDEWPMKNWPVTDGPRRMTQWRPTQWQWPNNQLNPMTGKPDNYW